MFNQVIAGAPKLPQPGAATTTRCFRPIRTSLVDFPIETSAHGAVEDKDSDKALETLGIVLDVAFGPIAILV